MAAERPEVLVGLFEGLVELVAPTRCGGCDLPGELFCASCRRATTGGLKPAESCPRCAAPYGALVCTECWRTEFAFSGALALGELSGPLARAVVLHKDAGERRLGAWLGSLLGDHVIESWSDWSGSVDAIAWVPPSADALARRGFDHGAGIAIGVSARVGAPVIPLLARAGRTRDQRRLGRAARARNSAEAFECHDAPRAVLVVDDVLTTGATADSAAARLLAAGAEEVRVAVLARAW